MELNFTKIQNHNRCNISELEKIACDSKGIKYYNRFLGRIREIFHTAVSITTSEGKKIYLNCKSSSHYIERLSKNHPSLNQLTQPKNLWHDSQKLEQFLKTCVESISKEVVTNKGLCLQNVTPELQDNVDIVKTAVSQDGMALEFASDRLKDDEEVVKAAIMQNVIALRLASPRLRNNVEILKTAIIQCGMADNEEIVKAAVMQDGMVLRFASKRLRSNEEIVKAAVTQNGMALFYANEWLKDTQEIVDIAIKQNEHALEFASDRIKNAEEKKQLAAALKKDVSAPQEGYIDARELTQLGSDSLDIVAKDFISYLGKINDPSASQTLPFTHLLINTLLDAGNYETARDLTRKALTIFPYNEPLKAKFLIVLFHCGQLHALDEQQTKNLTTEISRTQNLQEKAEIYYILAMNTKNDLFIDYLEKAVAANPENETYKEELFNAYLEEAKKSSSPSIINYFYKNNKPIVLMEKAMDLYPIKFGDHIVSLIKYYVSQNNMKAITLYNRWEHSINNLALIPFEMYYDYALSLINNKKDPILILKALEKAFLTCEDSALIERIRDEMIPSYDKIFNINREIPGSIDIQFLEKIHDIIDRKI